LIRAYMSVDIMPTEVTMKYPTILKSILNVLCDLA
jgi:hypothetical protein